MEVCYPSLDWCTLSVNASVPYGCGCAVEIDDKKHHENVEMLTDKDLDAPVCVLYNLYVT